MTRISTWLRRSTEGVLLTSGNSRRALLILVHLHQARNTAVGGGLAGGGGGGGGGIPREKCFEIRVQNPAF